MLVINACTCIAIVHSVTLLKICPVTCLLVFSKSDTRTAFHTSAGNGYQDNEQHNSCVNCHDSQTIDCNTTLSSIACTVEPKMVCV